MREDFHQEDGHSSDLDQKRSGILLMVAELRVVGLITCEGVRVVVGDEAPLGGVAQVVFHGVRVVDDGLQVRVHEEGEKEKDGEVQVEVKGEVEENQRQTLIMACG